MGAGAVRTTEEFLGSHPGIERVVFVCFDRENYDLYEILPAG